MHIFTYSLAFAFYFLEGLLVSLENQWVYIFSPAAIYIQSFFGHIHILKIDFGLEGFLVKQWKKLEK